MSTNALGEGVLRIFTSQEKLPALKIDRVTYNYYHLALSADGQLYRQISRDQWQRYNPILTEWTTVSPAPTDVISLLPLITTSAGWRNVENKTVLFIDFINAGTSVSSGLFRHSICFVSLSAVGQGTKYVVEEDYDYGINFKDIEIREVKFSQLRHVPDRIVNEYNDRGKMSNDFVHVAAFSSLIKMISGSFIG